MRGRTAENRSRCPTRTTAIEAADSLASGGRSSDEKQNNETPGTRKAEKVEKCTEAWDRHQLIAASCSSDWGCLVCHWLLI